MRNTVKIIYIMLIALAFVSCTTNKFPFNISHTVPAADGAVTVKMDKNNNYEIEIQIEHIASPERLSPAKRFYFAWLQTEDNQTKNLGQIVVKKGSKAQFNGNTPFKPAFVFITAEDENTILGPSDNIILKTDKFEIIQK